jgi:PQQ-dependent dehydrogenase (methanol/ethanol family)
MPQRLVGALSTLRRTLQIACLGAALGASACSARDRASTGAPPGEARATMGASGAAADEDGQWVMAAKDYQGTRFSGLSQINAANVATLRPAWTFSTGVRRGHEAAPLVVGSTMYLVSPFPNHLFALDLARPGAPLKWKYTPPQQRAAQGVACCDVVNRGAAYADGKVFFNTLDNQTVAVDGETGKEVWRTKLGDINRGETMTMAPLVVKGKVLVGNSGGEMGVRGWLTALDAGTGKIVWRAYSTGPDADVLIGPEFKPFYPDDRGKDLGLKTWPSNSWTVGGGTVWGWLTYDPELDLLYYGTGNPGPWNPEQRPGDNKWTASVFARDVETGQAKWAYQWSPHDVHDYDGTNESIVLDLPIGGRTRKTLVRADRNGYLYVLDRATGEVISADTFVHVTSGLGVDLKTGKYQPNPEKYPHLAQVVRDICPAAPGGKDWQPSSFSPRTGLVYMPNNNLCMDVESLEANYIAGTPYVGMQVVMHPGPGGNRGEVTAWDPVRRRPVWKVKERFPVWSGTVVTAGDLVFYGTMEGWFKALDARSGKLLWQFKTESGIVGQPISYRGPDGKQYIAVFAGVGGWAGAVVAGEVNPADSTVGLGFAGAMGDLPSATSRGGTLYVFGLP